MSVSVLSSGDSAVGVEEQRIPLKVITDSALALNKIPQTCWLLQARVAHAEFQNDTAPFRRQRIQLIRITNA